MAQEHASDVLVIGGGAAAVRAAIAAASHGASVTLVDKGRVACSGSSPAGLHGLACTLNPETSVDELVNDVISAGCVVNDVDLVRTAVEASSQEALYLASIGIEFTGKQDGTYDFYKGTGHSASYGLTFSEELTGLNFVAVLCKEAWKRGVMLLEDTMVTDLLIDGGRVLGAVGIDLSGRPWVFYARAVVLAAGGANRIYPNVAPRIARPMYRTTGDGYALALRAGLPLVDMEFANFRETPPVARFGKYINNCGELFMQRYDSRGEMAPRGKIVEALYLEMQSGRGPICVQLNEGAEQAVDHMPDEYKAFVRACLEGKRPQVTITFQRLLGGVRIKADTSTDIAGLYVAGESAGGFHGADRLQGMAFLETQVFGKLAGDAAAQCSLPRRAPDPALVRSAVKRLQDRLAAPQCRDASLITREVQNIMWNQVGIVRDGANLRNAIDRMMLCLSRASRAAGSSPFDQFEAENLALTGCAVAVSALARRETRGTHRRTDFPKQDKALDFKHVEVRYRSGEIVASIVPSRT